MFTVIGGISITALVVACVGGSGSLGEFGDDGVASSSVQASSTSGGSSSGRTSSSTSTSTSSGISSTSTSSGTTTSTSSGTTTSSSGTTTSSGGSSGTTTIVCGSTTCSATTQYCIKPCCPSNPDCYAKPDGGVCDTGYTTGTCLDVSGTACVQQCTSGTTPFCSSSTTQPSLIGRSCVPNSTTRTVQCTCN